MNFVENIVLVHFDKSNAQGPFGTNSLDRKNVYLDSNAVNKVKIDEWWYCRLERNPSLMSNNYFAMPMVKVDSDFLANLSDEVWKDIAGIACTSFPDLVAEKVKALIPAEEDVVELSSEPVAEDAPEDAADSGRKSEDEVPKEEPVAESDIKEVVREEPVRKSRPSLENKVWYLGDDTIASSYFKDGRYFVCRSYDGRNLQVYPDRKGNIECRNHELRAEGLGKLTGYEGRTEMQFTPVKGMVMISI